MSAVLPTRALVTRDVRSRLKLTQEAFGDRMGVNGDTVSAYERGIRPVPAPVWKLLQHERVALGDIA